MVFNSSPNELNALNDICDCICAYFCFRSMLNLFSFFFLETFAQNEVKFIFD